VQPPYAAMLPAFPLSFCCVETLAIQPVKAADAGDDYREIPNGCATAHADFPNLVAIKSSIDGLHT